jgi:hypothetical protein
MYIKNLKFGEIIRRCRRSREAAKGLEKLKAERDDLDRKITALEEAIEVEGVYIDFAQVEDFERLDKWFDVTMKHLKERYPDRKETE